MFQSPAVVECPVVDHRNDTTLQSDVNRAKAFALLSYQMISETETRSGKWQSWGERKTTKRSKV